MGASPGAAAKKFPFVVDITRGFNSLYLYTDLVEHQLAGDFTVPLLHCMPTIGNKNATITVTCAKPHYVLVNHQHTEMISSEIKTEQNNHVSFCCGQGR